MAEPLAVCLHATRRAGEMLGKRVLVTGCGPIGALAILAARCAGAAEIVATDLAANALEHAARGRRRPGDRHGRDPGRARGLRARQGLVRRALRMLRRGRRR